MSANDPAGVESTGTTTAESPSHQAAIIDWNGPFLEVDAYGEVTGYQYVQFRRAALRCLLRAAATPPISRSVRTDEWRLRRAGAHGLSRLWSRWLAGTDPIPRLCGILYAAGHRDATCHHRHQRGTR